MFAATMFFMGLSVCTFAGLVCFIMARSAKKATINVEDNKAAWKRLKAALAELHSCLDGKDTAREKSLRSWAGTFVICAGLCMIGVLLEASYNQLISVKSICGGLVGQQTVMYCPPIRQHTLKHGQPAAEKESLSQKDKGSAKGDSGL
jgi:hypothetical protein